MSSSRSRVAALFAAVPLIVAVGPFVAPAQAADDPPVRQAALVQSSGIIRIGPNAGFLGDVARGVSGRTAIVAFDAAPSATVTKASVTLRQDENFAVHNEFDAADGFAIYKDLNDNNRLDPDDYAAGAVSHGGYSIDAAASGDAIVITVNGDSTKATGEDSYLLVVHPTNKLSVERKTYFTVPANGIVTSTSSEPSSTLTLSDILLDTKAPVAIPREHFTPVSRMPLDTCAPDAAAGTCGNDEYLVHRSGVPSEPNEKLGFFNSQSDLSTAGVLTRQNGDSTELVIVDVDGISTTPATLSSVNIGNGTGRTTADTRAFNNQTSDDVVVRQWDEIGNYTTIKSLTNIDDCAGAVGCTFTARGNDVTAPNVGYTVSMNNVTASSTENAVPVTGDMSTTDSAAQTGQSNQVAQLVKVQRVKATTSDPVTYDVIYDPTTETRSGFAAPNDVTTNVDLSSDTNYPDNWQIRALGRVIDTKGNATAPRASSSVVWKDTIPPQFVKISPIDANFNGVGDTGETVRVEFSELIKDGAITSSNVNTRLKVTPAGDSDCGSVPTDVCVNWGSGATVDRSPDGRVFTITLGEDCPALSVECSSRYRLPKEGDVVTADANVVDIVSNPIPTANRARAIGPSIVLAYAAETNDFTTAPTGDNAYGTNRDGVIDSIDVKFTGNVSGASVNTASEEGLFKVSVGVSTITATATAVTGDTVRLTFTIPPAEYPLWRTGATPVVSLTKNESGSTVVVTTGNVGIDAFELTSLDKAPPVPLKVSTNDADADGHLDQVLVKYTEAVRHNTSTNYDTNPCGYTVTDYTDSTYVPGNARNIPAGSGACTPAANQPSPVPAGATASDTVALKLPEKSAFDTDARPVVTFASNHAMPAYAPDTSDDAWNAPECAEPVGPTGTAKAGATCPVTDTSKNALHNFAGISLDGAGAAIIERTTADTNSDGRLDEIRVKFSEGYDTLSLLRSAQFAVTVPAVPDYDVLDVTPISATEAAVHIRNAPAGTGDTGLTPTLEYSGGISDLADPANPSPTSSAAATDKAGPAILAACTTSPAGNSGVCPVEDATKDTVAVLFSEAVETSPAAGDFVVEQPAGTPKAQSSTAPSRGGTGANENRVVTLSFPNDTIDPAIEGVVRLASAGAVNDVAATPNPSTQTSNATLYTMPTVSFDLTCPVAANPGYCVQTLVDTNATGSSGVTLWRFDDTARGTTPPDSEFSSSVPGTVTLFEGETTMYLTGRDAFGRLSDEDSDTITVYLPPVISGVQYKNEVTSPKAGTFTRSSTVMDGDMVWVLANAQGTDAAQWKANGSCLPQHMSIDYSGLTGKSTDNKVAPFSCDVTTTSPPQAKMEFPHVRAAGTTRFPVGTVLATSPSDPGSMIVDGANGKLARRQFISVNARRSWMITDASVIRVPSQAVSTIPRTTNLGYRDGALLKSGTGGYYYMYGNTKRPISTRTLAYWKIPTSIAYAPTTTELRSMATGTQLTAGGGRHAKGTWVKFSNGSIQQIVQTASGLKRRPLASTAALKTLVPTSHIVKANSQDLKLPRDTFLRGYRDGTFLKTVGGYGVIARGSLRRFKDDATLLTLGYNKANALTASGLAMPRVSGQAYRTGAVIDRYLIDTIVIKVTNKAGAVDTEKVLPSFGGIFGVGTLDPAPAGWDFSRS